MKNVILLSSLAFAALGTVNAQACSSSGFLAHAACQMGVINDKQAHEADHLNKELGHPVEKVVTAAATAVDPALGAAVDAGFTVKQANP